MPTWPGPTRAGSSARWPPCSPGAVGKDVVSRTWRKVSADWDAWNRATWPERTSSRLILDGTVVRVRLDRKATTISLLVVLGVRRTGRRCSWPSRTWAARARPRGAASSTTSFARGLRTPEFLITDGAAGLERALAALWPDVPAQRCTVHKHRNLLAHAPEALHEEVSADYTDMIYAATATGGGGQAQGVPAQVAPEAARPSPPASRRRASACSPSSACPSSQWKSARTTNAIERLHEEFKRRIKTQTVLPSAETAAMLFWALLASGQITMRKVDGWQTLAEQARRRQSRLTSPPDRSKPHRTGDDPLRQFPHNSRRHQCGLRAPMVPKPDRF